MRNWNDLLILENTSKIQLYLTYEELKRLIGVVNEFLFFDVVPYLWGIETSFINLRKSLICCFRCTLPMRNWNRRICFLLHDIKKENVVPYLWGIETTLHQVNTYSDWQIVVPYLWGIETFSASAVKIVGSVLYLTYEELKRFLWSFRYFRCFVVPYLWGIETLSYLLKTLWSLHPLYLTYEELKHYLAENGFRSVSCCTLPMRNWNKILNSRSFVRGSRCTLPMRNWNRLFSELYLNSTVSVECCTLPMRNWNTISVTIFFIFYLIRCTLPMRNWNTRGQTYSLDNSCCTLPMRNWNHL